MRRVRLGDCLTMIKNGANIAQRKDAKGLPITRIETLSNDKFNRDRLGYADVFDIEPYSDYVLEDDDILMSHINSREFLGRCVLYKKQGDEKIIHGMNLLRLKTNKDLLTPHYAYYFFQTKYFKKSIQGIRKDAINQSSIAISDIVNIEFDLPTIEEQNKIANVLCNIDNKIELDDLVNVELEKIAKYVYDYWFVQFDFPNKEGNPYKSSGGIMVYNEILKREIPADWEVEPIEKILDKVTSTPRLLTDDYLASGSYPIIDQTTNKYFVGFTNREDAVCKQYPAVVFGDHSCAVKYVNFPFVRGADGTQIMISKDPKVSSEYLYFAVKSINVGKGYARHYSFIKDYPIIKPSETIAKKYKEIAETLFCEISQRRFDVLELQNLRDYLLPLLMNGQVTIKD